MKKRILALILATLCLVTLLCGCKDDTSENNVNNDDVNQVVNNDVNDEVKEDEPFVFRRGTVTENVYTNEVLNITFTASANMVFATDDEIAATLNLTKDVLNADDLFAVAEITTVMDFMAQDMVSGSSANLTVEDLSKANATNITMEQYVEITKANLESFGWGYTFGEAEEVVLGEETYTKITASLSAYGIEQGIYIRKVDKYMVCITTTVVGEGSLADIENMFS